MRVAVIDDVIDVGRLLRAQPPRIVPEPMRYSLDGEWPSHTAQGQLRQAQRERRSREMGRHTYTVSAEMRHQHVGDQIHAWPSLLKQVGDYRYSHGTSLLSAFSQTNQACVPKWGG